VLLARAEARYQAELADYEAKLQERAEKAQRSGRNPGDARLSLPPLASVTRSNTISPIRTQPLPKTATMLASTKITIPK
jgi:hypothetical protein